MKRGSECQIPEVIIPQPDLGDSTANLAAFKEVKRLISEGEPVIVRLVYIYMTTVLLWLYTQSDVCNDLIMSP